jgi:salicylate hydroxylase
MAGRQQRIAIIGGGIGGLCAALSLLQAGCDVQVYEQASALGEIGAGIQISPNASRILYRLGLANALAKTAVRPLASHQRGWDDGRTLQRSVMGDAMEAAFGTPYFHFHRADLLRALIDAVPAERVHLRHRFEQLTDHGDAVEVRFANGATISADLLVGADGIHSAVRAALFGAEHPQFTGCIAYRGLVPAERLGHLELELTAGNWLGPGRHFVHYFVAARRLLNFVAVIEQESWTGESWTDRGQVADALAAYDGWHPQVRGIIGAVDETFIWALFDRAPLPHWSVGRTTLLGDACHAMLPFMAQGAAQSIEDGATLAACLQRFDNDHMADALRLYETLRLPRASKLQAMSRANKTRFHLPDGPAQLARDAELAVRGDRAIPTIGWLYAHDAGKLEP